MPIPAQAIEKEIERLFARKGDTVVQANVRAFRDGKAQFQR